MSIYTTLWQLKFPLHGRVHTDCEWEAVLAQGVPEHIGEEGNTDHLAFLPPRGQSIANGLRAVVLIRALQEKGTERSAQEYPNPLLVLTGKQYSSASFADLHEQISNALLGARPRVVAEVREATGAVRVLYEDGSSQVVPRSEA